MEPVDLTGRFLILDDSEGCTLSRFAERIQDRVYLMEPLCPVHGEPVGHGGQFLVDIALLALMPGEDSTLPRAMIFLDYAAVALYHERMGGVVMPDDDDEAAEDAATGPTLQ